MAGHEALTARDLPADPAELGVLEAAAALRARRLSALELTDACLSRIESRNGGPPSFDGAPGAVNAWARLYPEEARAEAREADRRLAAEGEDAPLLCGIPLAVKDLYAVAGRPVRASSRVLDDDPVAVQDAAVVARLRRDGMVVLGHTHTHEFAAGGTTDQVGNPFDLSLSAGGSSGGSAAALAARMVPAALGTDTCGSLRVPSTCCGTSTIKPAHGAVSLDGIVPLAPSLDHPGPMARTVADAAALLSVMATIPETSALMPPPAPLGALPLRAGGDRPFAGRTVALSELQPDLPWEPAVAAGFEAAHRALVTLGARVVAAPSWPLAWEDLNAVLLTEMRSYHERFSSRRDRYRPAIAELLEAAEAFDDGAAYFAAQLARSRTTAAYEDWFRANDVDLLCEPTLAVLPQPRGDGYARGHAGGVGDPLIALTARWDMTGMPVVSLPVAWNVGVSLVAPRGGEAVAVQAGIDLQAHALGLPDWPE